MSFRRSVGFGGSRRADFLLESREAKVVRAVYRPLSNSVTRLFESARSDFQIAASEKRSSQKFLFKKLGATEGYRRKLGESPAAALTSGPSLAGRSKRSMLFQPATGPMAKFSIHARALSPCLVEFLPI
jgi:hypothetical protein